MAVMAYQPTTPDPNEDAARIGAESNSMTLASGCDSPVNSTPHAVVAATSEIQAVRRLQIAMLALSLVSAVCCFSCTSRPKAQMANTRLDEYHESSHYPRRWNQRTAAQSLPTVVTRVVHTMLSHWILSNCISNSTRPTSTE